MRKKKNQMVSQTNILDLIYYTLLKIWQCSFFAYSDAIFEW